jgi:hypothetical protein
MMPRIPAFQAALAAGRKITKAEAEKALGSLDAHVAQHVLDTASLSPGARQVLVDFVTRHAVAARGSSVIAARAASARGSLERARKTLRRLIADKRMPDLPRVLAWLDSAAADIAGAEAAWRDPNDRASSLGHLVDALLTKAKTGDLTPASLTDLRTWLDDHAGGAHGGGGGHEQTMKFPSDDEDSGSPLDPSTKPNSPPALSQSRIAEIRARTQALVDAGQCNWQAGTVVAAFASERFYRLDAGGGLTAFLPLGPIAPLTDDVAPADVDHFYLERAHPLAWSGPFSL